MKKAAALLLSLLFLAGCSGAEEALDEAVAFRQKLLSGSGCSFSADITADYGEEVYSFSMDCLGDQLGGLSFTVTSPESIADITGKVSEGIGQLTFDNTALQFDLMAEDTLSPVSAPWILLKTLRSGYIVSACREGEQLRLSIDDSYREDALRLDIWMEENGGPVRAEILQDGMRILTLKVKEFRIL